jgi:hypothetical protein
MKKKVLTFSSLVIGSGLFYAIRRLRAAKKPRREFEERQLKSGARAESFAHELDDQGTDQFEASRILKNIRDEGFDSSDERFALALGRPTEEIVGWMDGTQLVDADVLLKAKALANQRGIPIQ